MPPIYISYRPQDAAITEKIIHRCLQTYGAYSVIVNPQASKLDDVRIENHIDNLIAAASTVLIVIGRDWSGIDQFGRFRLSLADIPVRAEVFHALRSRKQVIVVLVNGARLPDRAHVPDELHGLFDLPMIELRDETLRYDLNNLIHPPSLVSQLRYFFSLGWTQRYTQIADDQTLMS